MITNEPKKHLQSLSQEELVEEILKFSKKFKDVKAHYEMDLGGNEKQAAIVEEFKKKTKNSISQLVAMATQRLPKYAK